MKPIRAIYVLHNQQGQSLGDQGLMKFINLVNDSMFYLVTNKVRYLKF